jgi:hypothetical protein
LLLIGVHYPKDKLPRYSNTCAPTYHFMVIVGRGYDETLKKEYYRFYDVGRTLLEDGANVLNRLYVDEVNKKIAGTYRDKTYTITEVRPNH